MKAYIMFYRMFERIRVSPTNSIICRYWYAGMLVCWYAGMLCLLYLYSGRPSNLPGKAAWYSFSAHRGGSAARGKYV